MGDGGGRHPTSVLLFKRIHRADVTRLRGARLMPTFLTSGVGRGRSLGDVSDLSSGLTRDHRLVYFYTLFQCEQGQPNPPKGE